MEEYAAESVSNDKHVLLTHVDRSLRGNAMFYYVIDPTEDIEVLETVQNANPSLMREEFLVCKVRIKPYNHVRWTWFSFLDKETVRRSSEKLMEEAREATIVFSKLVDLLSSDEKFEQQMMDLRVFRGELSHGKRKKFLAEKLAKSLANVPLPNETIERSIFFLLRLIDQFNEEAP